jgi:TrmH family RNA methyltransferase
MIHACFFPIFIALMKTISSRQNPLIKDLHLLATSAQERRKQAKTILDGVHLVQAALEQGVPLGVVCVSEHGYLSAEISALIAVLEPLSSCYCLPDTVFSHISPTDTPAGILAVINMPTEMAEKTPLASCVVLDGVQDAGNLGTILRTAAASGIEDILLTAGCAQAWSPRVLRAAMGAHFRLRIQEKVNLPQLLADFRGVILATGVKDAKAIYDVDLTQPVAWLFGSEGAGISAETAALAQQIVMIPMASGTESLNVAAAAAVCLFEERRQKSLLP